jgi:hypothetical protein
MSRQIAPEFVRPTMGKLKFGPSAANKKRAIYDAAAPSPRKVIEMLQLEETADSRNN